MTLTSHHIFTHRVLLSAIFHCFSNHIPMKSIIENERRLWYAPGTGTPVIGGPSSARVRKVLWNLRGINVVAADMVEILPDQDPSNIIAIAGAALTQDVMYLMYEIKSQ